MVFNIRRCRWTDAVMLTAFLTISNSVLTQADDGTDGPAASGGVSVVMHLSDIDGSHADSHAIADPLSHNDVEQMDVDHGNHGDTDLAHESTDHSVEWSDRGICYAPGRPEKRLRKMLGDRDRSANPPYRYTISNAQRAGNPHCVAPWAKPSINKHYSAWFVGGGAVFGEGECCEPEGTWGMDYNGWLKPRRVWMKWTGGLRQGGEGGYKTDGHTELVH